MNELDKVKELLKEEQNIKEYKHPYVLVIPILHNHDRVFLQMNGWSINLYHDGTWSWESTDGG